MASIDEKIDQLVVLLTDRHGRTEAESVAYANELGPDQLDEIIKSARNPAAWRAFAGARLGGPAPSAS